MLNKLRKLFTGTDDSLLTDALKNGAFLVDVRTPAEYASGSVQGAINIPLAEVSAQINKFKGKDRIVVFCQSGSRSQRAKAVLEHYGLPHVVNGGSWIKVKRLTHQQAL